MPGRTTEQIQLATRSNPKRLADDAKQSLLAKAQTPAGKAVIGGPANSVVIPLTYLTTHPPTLVIRPP